MSLQESNLVSSHRDLQSANGRLTATGYHGGADMYSKITKSRSLMSRPGGMNIRGTEKAEGTSVLTKSVAGESSHHNSQKPNVTKAGVIVETMSAPNPFCPNTRGICCLMLLVNLGLILIAIGFIIVLQLPEPAYVWNIGIVVLVFGFIAIFVSLVYCMCICQESDGKLPRTVEGQPELFWTHRWQKNITIPEIRGQSKVYDDHLPVDYLSDTSSRDYPRLYVESDYGQRTDREGDLETEHEVMDKN